MSCSDYPTAQTAKTFKLDAETTNQVVTLEQDRTNPASDGKTKKTLWGIENDFNDFISEGQQEIQDAIENTVGKSYIGTWAQGVTTFNSMNEYSDFNGITYKPKSGISLPYVAQTPDPTIAPDNVNVEPFSDVNSSNLSSYTHIAYKASGGNSSVENMIAGIPIAAKVGDKCSTGGTNWTRVANSGDISDFIALNGVWVADFTVIDGSTDNTPDIQTAANYCKDKG